MRWLFIAAYALNPLVLNYSADGMSESMTIFFLITSAYLFLRWTETGRGSRLVLLAFVTAAGTFVRYEVWVFAVLLTGGVSLWAITRKTRWRVSETRIVMYLLPVAYAISLWFLLNAIIERDPLYFYHGPYSQASVATPVASLETWPAAILFVLERAALVYPAYLLGLAALLVAAIVTRRWKQAVVLGVVSTATFLTQTIIIKQGAAFFGLRYYMYGIPFAFLIAAYILGQVRPWWLRLPLNIPVLVLLVASSGFTVLAQNDPVINDERPLFAAIVTGGVGRSASAGSGFNGERIADQLKDFDPHALIAVDSLLGFGIELASPSLDRFVVTSDRDFERSVAEPTRNHIKYFLVPAPLLNGALDRINRLYPGLWENGAGFATLEKDLGDGWRLYRIIGSTGR